MKKIKSGGVLIAFICMALIVASFFAKELVMYDFHMEVTDYSYANTDKQPQGANTSFWFSYAEQGRILQYGHIPNIAQQKVTLYALTGAGVEVVEPTELNPMRTGLGGYIIAALPQQTIDVDEDGEAEAVFDYARADFGPMAFLPVPQRFQSDQIPFELVFAERKYIEVHFENQPLVDTEILVTSHNGEVSTYRTDNHGWIDGLPISDIRNGFTATYSPNQESVFRMYYALEDYPYFSQHFWAAHTPLLLVFLFTAIGVLVAQIIRTRIATKNPTYALYSGKRIGLGAGKSHVQSCSSKLLIIRWLCLISGMFLFTYGGRLIGQGQALNEVSIPVFSCPFNLDQVTETGCYYLTHLPALFSRFGVGYGARNILYGIIFIATTLICFVFLGRILCGFLCPAGLLQDLMDKLRRVLHIQPITVNDRMNRLLQPLKWVWILLFIGFAFTGGDFCNTCPMKVFATAQGGFWTNLYLNGFLAVAILVGSFFIHRFWCLICPLGYLMGIFHKFNLFQLKKDCTACTECGACYDACPMRLKNIYKERDTEKVQTVDCMMCGECIDKCPEDKALAMTFCKKTIYKSSRANSMKKYAARKDEHEKVR